MRTDRSYSMLRFLRGTAGIAYAQTYTHVWDSLNKLTEERIITRDNDGRSFETVVGQQDAFRETDDSVSDNRQVVDTVPNTVGYGQ